MKHNEKYYPPHIHTCRRCGRNDIVASYPVSVENLRCCWYPSQYMCRLCAVLSESEAKSPCPRPSVS